MTALVVIAKACIPGRVKTRLHPPFTLEGAAAIAAASLADTIETAARVTVDRRILFFDAAEDEGTDVLRSDRFRSARFEIIRQPAGPLDERIAAVFDLLDEPTLLIGMDTPQVTAAQLHWPSWSDAVFGPSEDGGFWALGLRNPRGDIVRGIPMSRADTGARQLEALVRAGLTVEMLETLRDVDTADDADAVAAEVPSSRFARAVGAARSYRSEPSTARA